MYSVALAQVFLQALWFISDSVVQPVFQESFVHLLPTLCNLSYWQCLSMTFLNNCCCNAVPVCNSVTPWFIILEKLLDQILEKIHSFYGTPGFIMYIWAQQWFLFWAWWIKSITSYPVSCKLHFNSPSRLRKLPLSCFHVIILYAFHTFTLRATSPGFGEILLPSKQHFKQRIYCEAAKHHFLSRLQSGARIIQLID